MKKIFTLAAAGVLAAASLSAQAQVTVDGTLNATEISATGYKLIGTFTNPHSFGNFGLLSLYAAADANKVYVFVGGTVQNDVNSLNSFQLFLHRSQITTGAAARVALPTNLHTATSFKHMTATMDFGPDAAIAIKGVGPKATATGHQLQIEGTAYTTTTAVDTTFTTALADAGSPVTLSAAMATNIPAFAGAVVAYKNSPNGTVTTNPATPGGATTGWEMSFDRTAMGLTAATSLQLFAVQSNDDGGYISGDFIPQQTTGTTGVSLGGFYSNPSVSADFTAIPGNQVATLNLSATNVTLGSKAAAAAAGLSVYPNPVQGTSTVTYQVTERATNVHIVLTDLLGRTVRTIENGLKAVGTQTATVDASALAAGTYLVRVQVGENVSTSKVAVL